MTLSACASQQAFYRPQNENYEDLTALLKGRRVLIGGHLTQATRKQTLEGRNQGFYPSLPSELRLYDVDNKNVYVLKTDHFAHVYFQNPVRPMQIVGCMKWGRRAGVWQLNALKESYSFDAPQGSHFYGHGLFTSDGKNFIFSSAQDSDGKGALLVYDSSTGKLLNRMDSRGRLPHDLVWIEQDKKLLISQSPDKPTKSGRGGRITHLNLETGKAELQFDSDLPSTHVMRIAPDLVSSGSTDDNESQATWFLMRETDRSLVRDFRSVLPQKQEFLGEALSQRYFKDVIIMSSAPGTKLYAWDPKTFNQTHIDLGTVAKGIEILDGKLLVNIGQRGDLYRLDFDKEKFAFTTPELVTLRVSNSSHLQIVQL